MSEIVIIGAGIIGCNTALELARRGMPVVVVDRLGEAGHGTTAASCGIVRRFYSTDTMTAVAQESAEIWARWGEYLQAGKGEDVARFERCGMLFIPPRVDEGVRSVLARMERFGVDAVLLSRDEVAERFGFLDTRSHSPVRSPGDDDFFDDTGREIEGAVFERDAGYVISPLLATKNLRDAAEREGVEFRLGCGVTAIAKGGATRFRLTMEDGSTIETDVLVNAAGAYSTIVNRMGGVSLPLETRPLRREVNAVGNPEFSRGKGSPVPIVGDVDSGIFLMPEAGGRELLFGSLDPECDAQEWVEDPDSNDVNCTVAAHERHALRLMKRFPAVRFEKRRGIGSLYDVTLLDWNPIVDKTDEPGYYVSIGTSGSSFKTAPILGAALAEVIEAGESGRDHDRDPVHLSLPRTGFDLDVSFFSRLRGAHASSGTVLG